MPWLNATHAHTPQNGNVHLSYTHARTHQRACGPTPPWRPRHGADLLRCTGSLTWPASAAQPRRLAAASRPTSASCRRRQWYGWGPELFQNGTSYKVGLHRHGHELLYQCSVCGITLNKVQAAPSR
eukprot:365014-Chlamydomonas_euryale.AAC.13